MARDHLDRDLREVTWDVLRGLSTAVTRAYGCGDQGRSAQVNQRVFELGLSTPSRNLMRDDAAAREHVIQRWQVMAWVRQS